MSEFECIMGHLMLPSQGRYCKICGCPVYRMDGLTNSQHRKMEEMEEKEAHRYGDDNLEDYGPD